MSQVTELHIVRADQWSPNKGMLVGKVTIASEEGKQEIRLTAVTISAIFNLIRSQASATARANAATVAEAIDEATAEAGLIENKEFIEGEA